MPADGALEESARCGHIMEIHRLAELVNDTVQTLPRPTLMQVSPTRQEEPTGRLRLRNTSA